MATIYIERERYTAAKAEDNFSVIALTGDTFQAKDIIKNLGDFSFSDQVSTGKAWRTAPILDRNIVAGNAELTKMQGTIKRAMQTLGAAGYTVYRR